jgi:hypothetical protein
MEGGRVSGRGGPPALPDLARLLKGSQLTVNDVRRNLPENALLQYVVPCEDDLFGVVHKDEEGRLGCGVWTGFKMHHFGMYSRDDEARMTATSAVQMVQEDRRRLASIVQQYEAQYVAYTSSTMADALEPGPSRGYMERGDYPVNGARSGRDMMGRSGVEVGIEGEAGRGRAWDMEGKGWLGDQVGNRRGIMQKRGGSCIIMIIIGTATLIITSI